MLVRELSTSEADDPRKRQRVQFWNFARSLEDASDIRLAVWHDDHPTWSTVPVVAAEQPVALFGWRGRSRYAWVTMPLDAVRRDPALLGKGHPEDVVLARRSLPPKLFAELENRFDYRPGVDGQIEGWWFLDEKPVPKTAPTSRSTIALLPGQTTRTHGIRDGAEYLVLIDIDDWWAVLSTAALRVYQVGAALDDKLPVSFAQWNDGRRSVWRVELASPISHVTVARRFGREAGLRSRPDMKSIVVRCCRQP